MTVHTADELRRAALAAGPGTHINVASGVYNGGFNFVSSGPRFEAEDIRVEGNTFLGGDAPAAFAGVDGARFRFNTLYLPERWALRILQENREKEFVPSRNGRSTDDLVVFRSEHWSEGGVNRGYCTQPESFHFEHNSWCCIDVPSPPRELLLLPLKNSAAATASIYTSKTRAPATCICFRTVPQPGSAPLPSSNRDVGCLCGSALAQAGTIRPIFFGVSWRAIRATAVG